MLFGKQISCHPGKKQQNLPQFTPVGVRITAWLLNLPPATGSLAGLGVKKIFRNKNFQKK